MSTNNEKRVQLQNENNSSNKKIDEQSSYSDSGFHSGFIASGEIELTSEWQLKHHSEIADNKSKADMTASGGNSQSKDSENYTDSGIVSCSNISSSLSSPPDTQITFVQPFVPECLMRSTSRQHPTLQIEKFFEQDEDGYTKLHIAILHNIEPAINALISYAPHPSYLNIRNFCGQTALHLAVLMGQSVTVRKLIDAGIDVNVRDNRCNSALHLAVLNADILCAQTIISALYPAVKSQGESARSLIANLEQWNYDGETCFYIACKMRNVPLMKILAASGANINAREGRSGYSALHYAVETQATDVIKFLCEDCASVNLDSENYAGLTAFQLSLLTSQEALAEYLVQKGAEAYFTPESDYDDDEIDSDASLASDYEEIEKNQLVNKIAEIAVN
jgi:ankyrin repeat protein